MEVHLRPDQRVVVENLVASGRFRTVDEAVAEGVRMLVYAEKLREEVEVGIQQADRDEVVDHDTVFARLRTLAGSGQAGTD